MWQLRRKFANSRRSRSHLNTLLGTDFELLATHMKLFFFGQIFIIIHKIIKEEGGTSLNWGFKCELFSLFYSSVNFLNCQNRL